MSRQNILRFGKYQSPITGKTHYGCHGAGEEYRAFYKWAFERSCAIVYCDFPWNYLRFEDAADEAEFLKKYKNYFV